MRRALVATLVLSSVLAPAVSQAIQFMPPASRPRTSLLPAPTLGNAVAGDVNGDGRQDLVIGDLIAIAYLRTATGWTNTSLITPGRPRPVLRDLDGNGDLEVALLPQPLAPSGNVGAIDFVAGVMFPVTLPWSTQALGAAVGDLDADGFADFVIGPTVASGVPPLLILRGHPGLQFTLDTTSMPGGLSAGLWPELFDADSDGDLDILATRTNASGLWLLRNTGGVFADASATLPPARTGHAFLTSADFDGDGRADCAATFTNGDVDMFWGGASGLTFAQGVANVPGIQNLSPGDFDGDGDLDLLARHEVGLDVLWNQGNRQFTREQIVDLPTDMRGIADLDADGKADLVFRCTGQSQTRYKFGARVEDAAFATGLEGFPTSMRTPPLPGDVDGDGRTDLVSAGLNTVIVDRALGGGAYQRTTSSVVLNGIAPSAVHWTELADLDGDGDLDLVDQSDSTLNIAWNDGTGAFPTSLQIPSPGSWREGLRLGDVDGDGDVDIVHAETTGIVLVRNLGQGQFAAPAIVVPATVAPKCAELADVDGDGDLDIVSDVAAASGVTHVIVANDGAGNFAPNAAYYVVLGSNPTSVRAGDVDGDGDLDLLVADGHVRLFRNNGSGAFTETTPFDLPFVSVAAIGNLAVADFDGDGDVDVGALNATAPNCVLLFNDGTGRFTDQSAARGRTTVTQGRLIAGDIDDDGDVDLTCGIGLTSAMANHLRHCASNAVPRLGGVAELLLYSGPGFGSPGLAVLGVGFALASPPLPVPGLAGRLALDPTTLQIVAAVVTSSVGVSSVFVAVPQDPVLFGLELWFQGLIVPGTGQPGFTNAVYEVVLR